MAEEIDEIKGNPKEAKQSRADMKEYKKYLTEVKISEREDEAYIKRCDRVVRRFRDEDRKERNSDTDLPARYNILWSNTETVAPALYSRTPKVQVDRRNKDEDPVGRAACQIWERATQFAIDNYDFDGVMKAVVKDYQLAARGTAWVRYEPTVEDDQMVYQEVSCDHVHYSDFGHSPAKQWPNVRMVWRKVYLNRRQLIARFGKTIGRAIPLDYSPEDKDDGEGRRKGDQAEFKQARIYEIWDSDTQKVAWLSKGYNQGLLDLIDDPLGLHDFFPTPKPLYGVTTTETLIPIPDYCLYQDQARELDQITMKIALIEDALRMVGFYDATYSKELSSLYNNPRMNEMIPIANWQKLQAAGGLKGIAEWMSIKEMIEALQALYMSRDKVKQDLYEITGIADIVRGSSSQIQTTATEQQIKGQFATLRISNRQQDVQRYARDLIGLQGEIIVEHFEPEIIAAMCNVDVSKPDVQQLFYSAFDLLQNDPMRSFRLDIETDSMIAIDEAMDKQKTTEFITAFGGFLQGAMQALTTAPVLAPMLGETMKWMVGRFKAGRTLEASIDQGMQGLMQMAEQAMSQPKQDPEAMKVQAQIQLEQTKSQNDFQLKQQDAQQKMVLAQNDAAAKSQMHEKEMIGRMTLAQEESAQKIQLEREKMANELEIAREKAQNELILKQAELAQKDKIETKHAILKANVPGLHVLANGSITTHPTVIKEGAFYNDPATGERRVRIVEHAMESDGVSSKHVGTKEGHFFNDPNTGQRRVTVVDTTHK